MRNVLGIASPGAIGLTFLALAIWVMIRKVKGGTGAAAAAAGARGASAGGGKNRWLKIAVWLMLLAGLFLAIAGSRVVTVIVNGGRDTAGNFVGGIFGVTAGVVMTILGIIVVLELWRGIGPKGRPDKWLPYLALVAFPVFLGSGGFLATLAQHASSTATAWLS